jgi:hypothetical protein
MEPKQGSFTGMSASSLRESSYIPPAVPVEVASSSFSTAITGALLSFLAE